MLPPAVERDYLTPWPAGTAEKRFLERFNALFESDPFSSHARLAHPSFKDWMAGHDGGTFIYMIR